jgi:hypothetical protein
MSIIVSNTSIKYGGISTITVNNLLNVSITPDDSVINTDSNDGNSIVIYTVQPTTSTLYYITGYDTLYNQINLNTTIYVNTTLIDNFIEIPYNTSKEIVVYGAISYTWSPLLYLDTSNSDNLSTVICTPLESITYSIIGKDSFNTISRTYLKIIVLDGLVFTPTNPTVYEGNLLNLSVYYNNDISSGDTGNIDSFLLATNMYEEDNYDNYVWTFINGIPVLSITENTDTNTYTDTNTNTNTDTNTDTNTSEYTYVWKSKLFDTLPPNCVYYKYGNNIKLHPYSAQEYNVKVYQNNNILTSGNIKINVVEKPMNIIDIDILPYILYKSIISRDKKALIKLLNENKNLVTKIINFYYNTLQTAYRMEWTNKTGISFSVKWNTLYQIINESNEMILNFTQQWKFFQYINYHQTRNKITTSNFAYLLNIINEIYLEFPKKIGIYPLLSN